MEFKPFVWYESDSGRNCMPIITRNGIILAWSTELDGGGCCWIIATKLYFSKNYTRSISWNGEFEKYSLIHHLFETVLDDFRAIDGSDRSRRVEYFKRLFS
jgi:hypothetical protein